MARIAFLGLGVMGFPMAGHLQKAGHAVIVYNRTTTKAKDWAEVLEEKGIEFLEEMLSPFKVDLSDSERIEKAYELYTKNRFEAAKFVAELISDFELKQKMLLKLFSKKL